MVARLLMNLLIFYKSCQRRFNMMVAISHGEGDEVVPPGLGEAVAQRRLRLVGGPLALGVGREAAVLHPVLLNARAARHSDKPAVRSHAEP